MPRNHIGGKRHATAGDASGVWYAKEVLDEIFDGNWPNKFEVDVGSFQARTSTGSQVYNLNGGKTFVPKCILFFASYGAVSGTWRAAATQLVGFSDGTASYCVSGASGDAVATSNTGRRMANVAISQISADGATVLSEASLTGFGAGTFTLNWTAGNINWDNQISYVALGGDIEAEVLNWTTPTATGNKSVSTGTFQPDLVFHTISATTSMPESFAHMVVGLGAMNSVGEQWTVTAGAIDGISLSNTYRYQRTDKCLAWIYSDVVNEQASYVSMDANGFTVNFDIATNVAYQAASLCIKGVRSKLGAFNKTTAAAPATQSITAPGFSPAGLLFASFGNIANTAPEAYAMLNISATNGTNERAVSQVDHDATTPTIAKSIWKNDKAVVLGNFNEGSPIIIAEADATFTGSGFDLEWTTNDAAARQILYAAIASQ